MRSIKSRILFGIFFAIMAGASWHARANDSVAHPNVSVRVIGPDLKPIANRQISWQEVPENPFPDTPVAIKDAMTDGEGRFAIFLDSRMHKLEVRLTGVGFGFTGQFRLKDGEQLKSISLPPLAPFARIEGKIDGALISPATTVNLSRMGRGETNVKIDAEGRFVFADLFPDEYWIVVHGGKVASAQVSVSVGPGQKATGIVVRRNLSTPPSQPAEDEPAQEELPTSQPAGEVRRGTRTRVAPRDQQVEWVSGTVRDERGKPIAGAELFAVMRFQGSIRMYEQVADATSNAEGRYVIRGQAVQQMISGSVVCHQDGMVLAASEFGPSPDNDLAENQPRKTPIADFSLSSRGGSLDVHVSSKPANDNPPATEKAAGDVKNAISVQLTLEGGVSLTDRGYFGTIRSAAREQLESKITPTAKIDVNGVAHFEMLLPGLYTIRAYTGNNPDANRFGAMNRKVVLTGLARGVALSPGEHRTFDLRVYPQPNDFGILLRRPDGKPPGQNKIGVSWGRTLGGGSTSSADFDAKGLTRRYFEAPGFWHVQFVFRDTPIDSVPVNGPAYKADAVLAVSTLLAMPEPIPLTALWRDGSKLAIHLLDAAGKPVRGWVIIPGFEAPAWAGTTDIEGRIDFADMPAGSYAVCAYADGIGPVKLNVDPSPFPTDAVLSGHSAFVSQKVELAAGSNDRITIQARPIGYLRGIVIPEKGHKPADYYVDSYYSDIVPGPMNVRYDRKTGEFIYGPFLEGSASVSAMAMTHDRKRPLMVELSTTIKAGEVKHVTLAPSPATQPAAGEGDQTFIGMGGISVHGAMTRAASGKVFYDDGKSPAWQARVFTYVPEAWQAVAESQSDATGQLHQGGRWYDQEKPSPEPFGSPTEPVAVALLPGEVGGVVVPLRAIQSAPHDQPFKFILPHRIKAHGHVTVGGKSVAGRDMQLRVLAAINGLGKIGPTLSVSTFAQSDGSFDLRGLTPGTYSVQASIDDVWVSSTVELKVTENVVPEIALDVPALGQPYLLHLIRADGAPAANCEIAIDVPTGPLAEALLPSRITSDGAGDVYLSGLSAGRHRLNVAKNSPIDIEVPTLVGAAKVFKEERKLTQ